MSTYIGTKRQPCRLVLVQKSSNTILYISRLRFRLRGLNFFTASTPSHSRSRREILRPQLHGARRITVGQKTRKEKKGAIIYIKVCIQTNVPLLNVLCTTIPGHFFAICVSIFHKTEVLTVILRCLTGLIYDWLKIYDAKRKYFHFFFFFAILYKNR